MTKNTIEALNRAQFIASEYGNATIDTDHLLLSTLEPGTLVVELLSKMKVKINALKDRIVNQIEKKSKVHGQQQIYLSNESQRIMMKAEK